MRFYTILGLKKEATNDEVLAVYHAFRRSGEINTPQKRYALSVLINQETRANYDAFIRRFEQVPREKDTTELFIESVLEDPKYAGYLLENEISFPINFKGFLKILERFPRFAIDKIPNFKIILHADYCDPKLRIDLFECVRKIYPNLECDDKYLDLLDKSKLLTDFFEKNKNLTLMICIYYLRTDLLQKISYKYVLADIPIKTIYDVWLEGILINPSINSEKIREIFHVISERRLTGNSLEEFLAVAICKNNTPNMVEVFKLIFSEIKDDDVMARLISYALQHLNLNGEYVFRAISSCADNEDLRIRVTRVLLRFDPSILHDHAIKSGALATLLLCLGPHQLQTQAQPFKAQFRF